MTDHTVKVGDMFVESWGYDQTNVDVYEVVRVTPKSVALMKGRRAQRNGRVFPRPGDPIPFGDYCRIGKPNARGEVLKRVARGWHGEAWLNMTSYSGASLWDGERDYYDTHAAGHPGH